MAEIEERQVPEILIKRLEPKQQVDAMMGEVTEGLHRFEDNLQSMRAVLQADDTAVFPFPVEVEGISDEALALLKERLGVSAVPVEEFNYQYDASQLSLNRKRFRTSTPYLNLITSEKGDVRDTWLEINSSFGPETTGANSGIAVDLKKIDELIKQRAEDEIEIVFSMVQNLAFTFDSHGKGNFEFDTENDFKRWAANGDLGDLGRAYIEKWGTVTGISEQAIEILKDRFGVGNEPSSAENGYSTFRTNVPYLVLQEHQEFIDESDFGEKVRHKFMMSPLYGPETTGKNPE